MTKAEEKAMGSLGLIALVIGVPIYAVNALGEAIGWPALIGMAIALPLAYIAFKAWRKAALEQQLRAAWEARRQYLIDKYQDEEIVGKIMQRMIWLGQPIEQLRDSLGDPVDIDERVTKSKRRETWKYFPTGANRFSLRITIEDGAVTGWDDKR